MHGKGLWMFVALAVSLAMSPLTDTTPVATPATIAGDVHDFLGYEGIVASREVACGTASFVVMVATTDDQASDVMVRLDRELIRRSDITGHDAALYPSFIEGKAMGFIVSDDSRIMVYGVRHTIVVVSGPKPSISPYADVSRLYRSDWVATALRAGTIAPAPDGCTMI